MATLDDTQLLALRTDITVTNASVMWQGDTLLGHWNNGADATLASYYNQIASPDDDIWRDDVSIDDVRAVIDYSEWPSLTATDALGFNVLFPTGRGSTRMSHDGNRIGVEEIFDGPTRATTRQSILNASKRPGTNAELLYAGAAVVTSVDSISARISVIFGQQITQQNIFEARNV